MIKSKADRLHLTCAFCFPNADYVKIPPIWNSIFCMCVWTHKLGKCKKKFLLCTSHLKPRTPTPHSGLSVGLRGLSPHIHFILVPRKAGNSLEVTVSGSPTGSIYWFQKYQWNYFYNKDILTYSFCIEELLQVISWPLKDQSVYVMAANSVF